MAKAKGKPCVRFTLDKFSHITIVADPAEPFDPATTKVNKVVDEVNDITWKAKNAKKPTTKKLHIQLQGMGLKKKIKDNPPEAGTLTITLAGTAPPPVEPMKVEYVDDPS